MGVMICYLRLSVRLGILLFRRLDFTTDDILAHIILLAQVEEFANLRRTLGTETLREDIVGKVGDIVIALLDDDNSKNSNIGSDNTTTNGFAPALASTADAVARVTIREQKAHTMRQHDALLHREPLLVVSTSNTEDVTLPLVTEAVSWDFLAHSLLVENTTMLQTSGSQKLCFDLRNLDSGHTFGAHRQSRIIFGPRWRGLFHRFNQHSPFRRWRDEYILATLIFMMFLYEQNAPIEMSTISTRVFTRSSATRFTIAIYDPYLEKVPLRNEEGREERTEGQRSQLVISFCT
jgi:hypothetical protein